MAAGWCGWAGCAGRRTLRELDTPKIDTWTVWQDRAIRYFEMIDSASYARATGSFDLVRQQA